MFPLLLLAACGGGSEDSVIRVSVIGGPPTLVDPNRKPPDPSQRVLLGAVAEGLVAYDEAGQIAPALAQRWIVTSDGLSAIFRLRRASWPDGREITTDELARRAALITGTASRNPIASAFDSIAEISPTTPDVMEFRLSLPRPPLLELLAQPEAAMLSRTRGSTGPYKPTGRAGDTVILTPRAEPIEGEPHLPDIALTGERASRAVARFVRGETELVLGGTYLDWPLVAVADPDRRTRRLDPAEGLFGLQLRKTEGFLAIAENRRVLGMAIDRDALLAAFGAPGLAGVLTVMPQRYRSAADPAFPPWATYDLTGRVQEARRQVSAWRETNAEPVRVRLYLPEGPGSRLLFGRLAADWRRVGIETERVTTVEDADLVLIDRVAPAGSALWYLSQVACPTPLACSKEARDALLAARKAESLFERGTQLAIADRTIAGAGLYIPLTRPLRWSLVARQLTLFRENPKAWHPLHRLRGPAR